MANPKLSFGIQKSPWSSLIYGPGGIGKTTFVACAPAPMFVQVGEVGSLNLDVARLPASKNWEEIVAVVDEIISGNGSYEGYKVGTLSFDTADGMEKLAWDFLCRTQKTKGGGTAKSIEDFDFQAGYTMVLQPWRALLARLQTVMDLGINVAFIAHGKILKYSNPSGGDYDRIAPDLHKNLAALLVNWVHCVLYAYEEVAVVTERKGAKGKAVSSGVRMLHTVEKASYIAKNRYSLPDPIPLEYASFARLLPGAETPEQKAATIIASIREEAGQYAEGMEKTIAALKGDPRKLEVALNRLRAKLAEDAAKEEHDIDDTTTRAEGTAQ